MFNWFEEPFSLEPEGNLIIGMLHSIMFSVILWALAWTYWLVANETKDWAFCMLYLVMIDCSRSIFEFHVTIANWTTSEFFWVSPLCGNTDWGQSDQVIVCVLFLVIAVIWHDRISLEFVIFGMKTWRFYHIYIDWLDSHTSSDSSSFWSISLILIDASPTYQSEIHFGKFTKLYLNSHLFRLNLNNMVP